MKNEPILILSIWVHSEIADEQCDSADEITTTI